MYIFGRKGHRSVTNGAQVGKPAGQDAWRSVNTSDMRRGRGHGAGQRGGQPKGVRRARRVGSAGHEGVAALPGARFGSCFAESVRSATIKRGTRGRIGHRTARFGTKTPSETLLVTNNRCRSTRFCSGARFCRTGRQRACKKGEGGITAALAPRPCYRSRAAAPTPPRRRARRCGCAPPLRWASRKSFRRPRSPCAQSPPAPPPSRPPHRRPPRSRT